MTSFNKATQLRIVRPVDAPETFSVTFTPGEFNALLTALYIGERALWESTHHAKMNLEALGYLDEEDGSNYWSTEYEDAADDEEFYKATVKELSHKLWDKALDARFAVITQ